MTDIVERLRDPLLALDPRLLDAADEIERLRAALGKIAADTKNCADHCVRQAQRALETKP